MSEVEWRQFSAVAYDFDGTIADTREVHTSARLEAFKRYGDEKDDARYTFVPSRIHQEAHQHGHHSIEIIAWVLKEVGITNEIDLEAARPVRDLKNKIYNEEALKGLPTFDKVIDFIYRGHILWPDMQGIVTSAYRNREVMPFIHVHKLGDVFADDRVVTAEDFVDDNGQIDLTHQKPNPDPYNLIIDRFDVKPSELLVFEDNSRGIQSAKTAGAFVIGMATTHTKSEIENFAEDSRPDQIALNFEQAAKILGLTL